MPDSSVESITKNRLGSQTLDAERWGPGWRSEPSRLLPVLPYRTKDACICANKTVIIVLIISNTFEKIADTADFSDGRTQAKKSVHLSFPKASLVIHGLA